MDHNCDQIKSISIRIVHRWQCLPWKTGLCLLLSGSNCNAMSTFLRRYKWSPNWTPLIAPISVWTSSIRRGCANPTPVWASVCGFRGWRGRSFQRTKWPRTKWPPFQKNSTVLEFSFYNLSRGIVCFVPPVSFQNRWIKSSHWLKEF